MQEHGGSTGTSPPLKHPRVGTLASQGAALLVMEQEVQPNEQCSHERAEQGPGTANCPKSTWGAPLGPLASLGATPSACIETKGRRDLEALLWTRSRLGVGCVPANSAWTLLCTTETGALRPARLKSPCPGRSVHVTPCYRMLRCLRGLHGDACSGSLCRLSSGVPFTVVWARVAF